MKALLRRGVYWALRHGGVLERKRAHRDRAGAGWASVLVFHRLSETIPEDGLTIRPARFRAILGLLGRHYDVVPLGAVGDRLASGAPFTGREVAITFDDGYEDNFELAAPLLAEFGMPATFFLTVGFVETARQFPWDVNRGVPTRMMTWSQAREMVALGLEVGCHTWSHPNLGTTPVEAAEREVWHAKRVMEDELGTAVTQFAYPFGGPGDINSDWNDEVRRAGFRANYSAHGGVVTGTTDPYLIPRVNAACQRTLTDLRIDIDEPW